MKVLLAAMLAAALAFASGIALGALSATVWVIGLSVVALGLVTGVALGAMLAATGALGVGPDGGSAGRRWSVRVAAFVAVLVGWGAIQLMDDGHLLAQNRRAVAERERADSPLSPVEMQKVLDEDDALGALLAKNADRELEAKIVAEVGMGGVVGRWWWRAGSGVRLAGSFAASRGLPVGRVGAVVWAVAENALATALALLVVRRVRRRVALPPTPSSGA